MPEPLLLKTVPLLVFHMLFYLSLSTRWTPTYWSKPHSNTQWPNPLAQLVGRTQEQEKWCSPLPRVGPWAGGSSPLEGFWGTRGSSPSRGSICFPSLLSLHHHWKTKLILCHLLCSCSPRSLSFLFLQTHPAERKMSRMLLWKVGVCLQLRQREGVKVMQNL